MGGEFVNNVTHSLFQQLGIVHQTSCTYTQEQNGCVERKYRHLLNISRTIKLQEFIPIQYWGYCILVASYLINLQSSSALQGRSPYQWLLLSLQYLWDILPLKRFIWS